MPLVPEPVELAGSWVLVPVALELPVVPPVEPASVGVERFDPASVSASVELALPGAEPQSPVEPAALDRSVLSLELVEVSAECFLSFLFFSFVFVVASSVAVASLADEPLMPVCEPLPVPVAVPVPAPPPLEPLVMVSRWELDPGVLVSPRELEAEVPVSLGEFDDPEVLVSLGELEPAVLVSASL